MIELERNLNEVTDKALETGENIVTVECPCCGKTFYVLESEAAYSQANPADQSPLKCIRLGRRCPHCGFAGGYTTSSKSKAELDAEKMLIEMEAEQKAIELAEKRQASWSKICSQSLNFEDPKDD